MKKKQLFVFQKILDRNNRFDNIKINKMRDNNIESICKECSMHFFSKYTLLFHSALEHNYMDYLCPKCYGVFSLIMSILLNAIFI